VIPVVNSLLTPAFINLPGPSELIIILVIVLLIFGPKKLPEMGKAIGQSIRELKKSTEAKDEEDKEEKKEQEA